MVTCPCCTDVLLHYIQPGKSYWFCRTCWSEMPNIEDYNLKNEVEKIRSTVSVPQIIESDLGTPISAPFLIVTEQKKLTSVYHYSAIAA